MPATVTLATTTLVQPVRASDRLVKLASTSGVRPGLRLWTGGESMAVVRLGVAPWVEVQRGVDGSPALDHASAVTVYIASADQLYAYDPVGRPPEAVLVSPWINVSNGKVWFAQGDVLPIGQSDRWWQEQTVARAVGALGVRTTTYEPTSST